MAVKVRLKKDIPGLGLQGQVVKVTPKKSRELIKLRKAEEYVASPRPPKHPFPHPKKEVKPVEDPKPKKVKKTEIPTLDLAKEPK